MGNVSNQYVGDTVSPSSGLREQQHEYKVDFNSFATKACKSFQRCKVSKNEKTICTLEYYKGTHVTFQNKCLVHKYNCLKIDVYILAVPEKCNGLAVITYENRESLAKRAPGSDSPNTEIETDSIPESDTNTEPVTSTQSVVSTESAQVQTLQTGQKIYSDAFANRACESLQKCKVSEKDEPLCTVNYDGNHVKFDNKCVVLKFNCNKKGVYLLAAPEECKDLPIISQFENVAIKSCEKMMKCTEVDNYEELCAYNLNNGSYVKLKNKCEFFRLNCKGNTLLKLAELWHCKDLPVYSIHNDQQLDWNSAIQPFSHRACVSWGECSLSPIFGEICAINFNNGTLMRFENKCLMLMYNCLKTGMLFEVGQENCKPFDKVYKYSDIFRLKA